MKTALSIKLGQSLSMTPALQQAIKLLQMASVDLQAEIQDALDSNLMLEPDEADGHSGGDASTPDDSNREHANEREATSSDLTEVIRDNIPDEPGEDFSWNDVYSGNSNNADAQQALYEFRQASLSAAISLQDHVLEQVRLSGLSPTEEDAAAFLLDSLDERGYIRDFDALTTEIQRTTGLSASAVLDVLRAVQSCDPLGVAARGLGECLQLQLQAQPAGAVRDLALRLVQGNLNILATLPSAQIARREGVSVDAVDAAREVIRHLQPHPGAPFVDHESQYVSPDLFVRKRGEQWEVHLNPEIAPRIRINTEYQAYVKRGDGSSEQQTLKQHLADARHFLHALRSRNDTLLRVGQQIVDLQRGFLEYGPEAMKPLVLRDIADRLGLHESTVSRATASKYMHTPRGLFELKYFFSSSVNQAEGGTCSATAIQAMIKRFVSGESPAKPLSDARLAQMLQDEGVNVARRTIAKYRETLGIPPTHERRVRT